MKNPTYKMIKASDNPYEAVFEKGNLTAEFTLADMEGEQRELTEYITKYNGQKNLAAAKMKNIEENHPFILKMSEQDLFTAHMYQEEKAIVKVVGSKIPALKKQLEDSKEEEAMLIKKFKMGVKTKDTLVNEAVAKITKE